MTNQQHAPQTSLTYREWLAQVDAVFWAEMGISHDDFTDQPWKDWYEENYSPKDAFFLAFEAEYPDIEPPEVMEPSVYYQEFDTFSDAGSGL